MIINITQPHFFETEAQQINQKLAEGLEILHLRKPNASVLQTENLLRQIDSKYYNRIVLHDNFELCKKYNLRGVHLNSRNPNPPTGVIHISKSCHSFEELKNIDEFTYVFLSPIFNSISKQGYDSAFTIQQLQQAQKQGLINNKVYALGGITTEKLPLLESLGFGGAAILGAAWQD